jgi:hypothetical protein
VPAPFQFDLSAYGWNKIIARPFGGLNSSAGDYNFRNTNYPAILKKLTTEESVNVLYEKIRDNQTSVFKITNESFVEVQKRTTHAHIYLWKYGNRYRSGTNSIGWECSNKHKVINLTGTITNAHAYVDDTLEIIEEKKDTTYKSKIRIETNRILTDASHPISLTQQLVQTLLLTRPLVWFRAFRLSDSFGACRLSDALLRFIYDAQSRFTAFFYRR